VKRRRPQGNGETGSRLPRRARRGVLLSLSLSWQAIRRIVLGVSARKGAEGGMRQRDRRWDVHCLVGDIIDATGADSLSGTQSTGEGDLRGEAVN